MARATYYAKFRKEFVEGKKRITGIIPQLGVATFGDSRESALEKITDALKCYLDTCKDMGNSVPSPKYIKNAEPITIELEDKKKKKLDSYVFIEIPEPKLKHYKVYRSWLDKQIINWLLEKEKDSPTTMQDFASLRGWNYDGGTIYLENVVGPQQLWCKFGKYDGTDDYDWGKRRGVIFHNHYSPEDARKVKKIADKFESFLKEKEVKCKRENYYRKN